MRQQRALVTLGENLTGNLRNCLAAKKAAGEAQSPQAPQAGRQAETKADKARLAVTAAHKAKLAFMVAGRAQGRPLEVRSRGRQINGGKRQGSAADQKKHLGAPKTDRLDRSDRLAWVGRDMSLARLVGQVAPAERHFPAESATGRALQTMTRSEFPSYPLDRDDAKA